MGGLSSTVHLLKSCLSEKREFYALIYIVPLLWFINIIVIFLKDCHYHQIPFIDNWEHGSLLRIIILHVLTWLWEANSLANYLLDERVLNVYYS